MILHRRVSAAFAALLILAVLSLAGCGSLKSISILPVAGTVTLTAVGQTVQFNAFGQSQMGNANPTTSNISTSVTWSVSNPSVAAISSIGNLTAVGPGYTQVLAQSGGFIATSDVTVTLGSSSGGGSGGSGSGGSGSGGGSSTATSLTVIPSIQTIAAPGSTTQFLAIGTNSSGVTINLTNLVTWSSSSQQIATIGAATGLATGVGQGTATITALYTNQSTGAVVTGTATITVTAGGSQQLTGLQILPGAQTLSASGQTGQFIALGNQGSASAQQDVTNSSQIKWISSVPSVATVSPSGVVTGINVGTTNITAEYTNANGSIVAASAIATIQITAAPEPLVSLQVLPPSITVGNLQDSGQFLAIGTYSVAPFVRDLTNTPNLIWISSFPNSFPVNTNTAGSPGATAGIVTAYGTGTAAIIAEAKAADGTIQTATATFSCPLIKPTATEAGSCYPGSQTPSVLATITVYNQGLNTTGWLVTAPSATGTSNVLHCGPGSTVGGSVCVASYPVGTTVTLSAPAETGVAFGGWSSNCAPNVPINANGPNSCTVTLTTNDTVGAIFN